MRALHARTLALLLVGQTAVVNADVTAVQTVTGDPKYDNIPCGPETITVLPFRVAVGQATLDLLGTYKICSGSSVVWVDGWVDWGDKVRSQPWVPHPSQQPGGAGLIFGLPNHLYTAGGIRQVEMRLVANCKHHQDAPWWGSKSWDAASCGRGTVTVYESAGISDLRLAPATPNGGSIAKATVVLASPSKGLGTLVLVSSADPSTALVPSDLIVTTGQTEVTFDIRTVRVGANTPVAITVFSGGVTVSRTLTVVP